MMRADHRANEKHRLCVKLGLIAPATGRVFVISPLEQGTCISALRLQRIQLPHSVFECLLRCPDLVWGPGGWQEG